MLTPILNKQTLTDFFKGVLIEQLSAPEIDLPELAIDHFDCRDNINAIRKIHTAAVNYIHTV